MVVGFPVSYGRGAQSPPAARAAARGRSRTLFATLDPSSPFVGHHGVARTLSVSAAARELPRGVTGGRDAAAAARVTLPRRLANVGKRCGGQPLGAF